MNNFNDRVYLLLTLNLKEIKEYYIQTVGILIALAIYNLISVFVHTPRIVTYSSLVVAFVLITILFIYLWKQALPIDWELLKAVDEKQKKSKQKPKDEKITIEKQHTPEPPVVEASNAEIKMVEEEEDVFDFEDTLMSLYKTGSPKQLSEIAVNGVESKVRRMNLR